SGFDQTIQPSAQHKVMVDRPMYDHADSLIFRPLPALEDEDRPATSKMLPYRFAIDPRAWSDFWVRYPAAAGVGTGDRRTTFLLCESGEDIRETPYSVLFE